MERVDSLPASRVARLLPRLLTAALALGARPNPRGTQVEARLRGRLHSRTRDSEAIRHHYDQPPEFYGLFLGRTMTYSCAYFETVDTDLDAAQEAKLDLVCRKLRLRPGERLLDIGCGWGSLVFHAAEHHGARAVGITASPRQAEWGQQRAQELGLDSRAEVRLADYRDTFADTFDAVASVGMVEHVGRKGMPGYCQAVHQLLRPGGRALIHGITVPVGQGGQGPLVNTFVFPDGQAAGGGLDGHLAAGGGARGPRRREPARALRPDAGFLGGPADGLVGRGGRPGGAGASARVEAVHERQPDRFRPRLARRRPDPRGPPGRRGASGVPLTRADWYGAAQLPLAAG